MMQTQWLQETLTDKPKKSSKNSKKLIWNCLQDNLTKNKRKHRNQLKVIQTSSGSKMAIMSKGMEPYSQATAPPQSSSKINKEPTKHSSKWAATVKATSSTSHGATLQSRGNRTSSHLMNRFLIRLSGCLYWLSIFLNWITVLGSDMFMFLTSMKVALLW